MKQMASVMLVLSLLGGCAASDVRMAANSKTFARNAQLEALAKPDQTAMPVSPRKVYLKSTSKWCRVGGGMNLNDLQRGFSALAGYSAPYRYKIQGDRLESMVSAQLRTLGMNLVSSESEADFVLTLKLEHRDMEVILGNAPVILSLFMAYPLTKGEACLATGSLIDRRGGNNDIVIAFDSWEGMQDGEKPIRTDRGLHLTPLSILVHTPINYSLKKDMTEAGTYLNHQLANGYVSRVRELMLQGMFY